MRVSFQFDHDAFLETAKVHDESVQHVLPPELETEHSTIAQQRPSMTLGRRALASELARERVPLTCC